MFIHLLNHFTFFPAIGLSNFHFTPIHSIESIPNPSNFQTHTTLSPNQIPSSLLANRRQSLPDVESSHFRRAFL
jgi:hypothetical protein